MVLRHGSSLLLAASILIGISGCPGAGGDIGTTLPVTGKVTIDDKPLEEGNITFHPMEAKGNKTKAGVSGIIKKGQYTVTSGTVSANANGAPPGWYKVTVVPGVMMTGTGNTVSDPNKGDFKPKQLSQMNQNTAAIAEKFTQVDKTPVEIEVKSGGNYDVKATSK